MPPDVRHYCDFPDCDKSFQRLEHLKRHKLNHTNHTIPCPKCDHLFYRNDLLRRHLTLKHGKSGSEARKARDNALERNTPTDEGANVQGDPELASLGDQSLSDMNLDKSPQRLGCAFQNGEMEQNPNPVESHPMHDVVPFSPFNLNEGYGQSPGWLFQLPREPAPGVGFQELQFEQPEANFQSQTPQNMLFDTEIPQPFPISAQTHSSILSLVQLGDLDSNPIATIEDMRRILDIATTYLQTSLPIFHQPTLSLELSPRELCAAFLSVGLLICGEPNAHEMGCTLLQRLRKDLIEITQNITIKKEHIWVLQSMLLVEFCGMFHANRSAMELSDIFHGTLVTLARRLGLFDPAYNSVRPVSRASADHQWWEWIQNETAKRLAYFIFVIDVQHSLLFGHDRTIVSVYRLRLDLPCDERGWNALTSYDWAKHNAAPAARILKFHEIQHFLLSAPDIRDKMPSFDALSAYLVLSGLASITCDTLQRSHDQFFNRDEATSKLRALLKAVADPLLSSTTGPMRTSGLTMYYISLVSLGTPLDDLERAANSGFSLTGLTPKQHARAALTRLLTRNKVGLETALYGIQLLRLFMFDNYRSVLPLEPSALYLGVLTLWAFIIVNGNEDESIDIAFDTEISSKDALDEMETAITNREANVCGKAWRSISRLAFERLGFLQNSNAREYNQVLRGLGEFAT